MVRSADILLEDVIRLAEAAGARINEIYETTFAVGRKADASPVTAADHEAEALIVQGLAALTPDIPIVAEEAMARGTCPAIADRFWLVDPLDGTKEFINRIGDFTVNIALIEAGTPVLGVVHIPVSGESFAAAGRGAATRRKRGGAVQSIAARTPHADGVVVLTSRFHADQRKLDAFLEECPAMQGRKVRECKVAGSALKFCLIAAGEADLYPRLGPTMEWDTAAGHALILGAGGSVETLDGNPLRYGKPDFLNSGFVARGR
ncbi:MAG TPA: 3'(2'),5'-bisphosphate nucleotidase CysQ [Alphaproteobacteria bacterium]